MGWMHSCREAASLLSRMRDERLGAVEHLRLRMHLRLCGDCAAVEQQLAQLDVLTADLFDGVRRGADSR